jgi:hypothetical protein
MKKGKMNKIIKEKPGVAKKEEKVGYWEHGIRS